MPSIRSRKESGLLFLDFRFRGERCREQTLLDDTPANRQRLEKLMSRIEKAMADGSFVYANFFPDSTRAKQQGATAASATVAPPVVAPIAPETPLFSEFAETWFAESCPRWRRTNIAAVRDVLDKRLIPHFGAMPMASIDRPAALAYRAKLTAMPGRGGKLLSHKRVNAVMGVLRMITNEAADRFSLPAPFRNLKALKERRPDVHPFTLPELQRLLAAIRADFRPYLTVWAFTGMRTGELNGLKWRYVDFDKNLIIVRETFTHDAQDDTKTDGSRRDIPMLPLVREALLEQKKVRTADCEYVFHSKNGLPINAINFNNRIWLPLLRHLGLPKRRPYQLRHTAATLMLASGENPEWVARILGHSTTEMLFRVYSRFVPNLTRSDGRAFTGLVESRLTPSQTPAAQEAPKPGIDLDSLAPDYLRALLTDVLNRLDKLNSGAAK